MLGVKISQVKQGWMSLMFIPCIISRIRKHQQYELICTTPLFYVLAPTCFGTRLGDTTDGITTMRHAGHVTTHYTIYKTFDLFQVTRKDLRSSLMMAGYCRNMLEPLHRI
jgi:hypothetical protein